MPHPQTQVNENQNPSDRHSAKSYNLNQHCKQEERAKKGNQCRLSQPALASHPHHSHTEEIENNSWKEIAAPQFLPETASFLNPTKSTAQSHISRKNRRIPFSELLHVRYWEENSGWKITVDNSTGRSFRQAPISAWRFQLSTTCAHRRRR
jgi:hypothetical protein